MELDRKTVEAASIRFAQELNRFPREVTIGVGLVIENIVNGCSWAFVSDQNEEFKKVLKDIANNPHMSVFHVRGGYLYQIEMGYLLKILGRTTSGLFNSKDLEYASRHRQKALEDMEKFMRKGNSGKIGIYNLNDSPRITVKGVNYPAFCISLQDLLVLCVRNGYGLKLGSKVRMPGQLTGEILPRVISNLEIAPSGNALFIEIAKL